MSQFSGFGAKVIYGPCDGDNEGARQENDELGELKELVVEGGKGQGDKNGEEVEGGDNNGLHK